MAYKNIKEKLYKKFCDSIGRGYNDGDIHDFYLKADTTYNGASNNVKEFKNKGNDKKAFIEHYKEFYETTEDNEAVLKGRNSGFIGLYRIGADERILDEILVSILKAAWEDSESGAP